jgi:hypothetical protein
MDRIDNMLRASGRASLNPSVKHALTFARTLLDKYYSKTDLSNVYRIAMGMLHTWLRRLLSYPSCLVLHPQLKLKYFQQHGWAKDWVDTAEQIVREEFMKYDTPTTATQPCVRTTYFLLSLLR